jgi:hypothetical protein
MSEVLVLYLILIGPLPENWIHTLSVVPQPFFYASIRRMNKLIPCAFLNLPKRTIVVFTDSKKKLIQVHLRHVFYWFQPRFFEAILGCRPI